MEHRIVFKKPDGSCGIIIPSHSWVFQPEADVAMAKHKAASTLAIIEEELRQTQASVEHRASKLAKFDAFLKDTKDKDKDALSERRQILVAGLEEAEQRLSQIASECSEAVTAKQVADELPAKMSQDDINARLELLAEKDVPAGLQWRITTCDKIPSDRTRRHFWTDNFDTDTVDVDESLNIDIPRSVSSTQIKMAACDLEYYDSLKNAVSKDQKLSIWFETASTWDRESPIFLDVLSRAGLSSDQADKLFIYGSQIRL